jgi:Zn ribbon nucleic-acid-binding protein
VRERFVKGEVFPRCPACEELATWTLDIAVGKRTAKKNVKS